MTAQSGPLFGDYLSFYTGCLLDLDHNDCVTVKILNGQKSSDPKRLSYWNLDKIYGNSKSKVFVKTHKVSDLYSILVHKSNKAPWVKGLDPF